MKTAEIRDKFLTYFQSHGHTLVASSSLVPSNDPTLLFTNSGMVQFKDVFLGNDKRPYQRATSSQRSLRAGGKHNDLENVGYTARHHTFFEMLGNFSFGDYFKEEAIQLAWTLLTNVYQLPQEKLLVTVYADDDDAYNLWKDKIGVPPARIIRIGDNKGARYASDNFWQMADTGPCGPCSEIFYDHGDGIEGGPPGSPTADGDRYIEIWNLVFMQFNRDASGVLHPLPKPSVDTGMGLERIAAVLQKVHSNYDIDIFQTLIRAAGRETQCEDLDNPSLKVLADHIRACIFMIVDGIIPGNEGRGYVLRRIIRRAIRHGYKLGARSPFFHRMVPDVVLEMGDAYPEIKYAQSRIAELLKQEEERFFTTIEHGMAIVEDELALMLSQKKTVFNGQTAFKLHDTYGFPLDLTADMCRERQFSVDEAEFDLAMAEQKRQARASGKFKSTESLNYQGTKTQFHGYDVLEETSKVLALYREGSQVDQLMEGEQGVVILDQTPFYAESGGQVGDAGLLQTTMGTGGSMVVHDTQKIQPDVFGHHGVISQGVIKTGDTLMARVDSLNRAQITRHHSATHLLHKALREVLGDHVQQKGSQVSADKTRFDFAHSQPISADDIHRIERLVNAEIIANTATEAKVMSINDAKRSGAMMLFGEKYGDDVRVLSIGTSKELCGGTHVTRSGDIGFFKIIDETGVAAGIRRIEAICGEPALMLVQTQESQLTHLAELFKSSPSAIASRFQQWQDERKSLERELYELKSKMVGAQSEDLARKVIDINGVFLLAEFIGSADASMLRETLSTLRQQLPTAIIVLAGVVDGKVNLIAGIPPTLISTMKAGELVNAVASCVGGKGGGKPDIAMAGGNQPENIPQALARAKSWVEGIH